MQGIRRKVVQAVLYELVAIVIVTAGLTLFSRHDAGAAGGLAVTTSLVAMVWNMVFNALFEAWERRQPSRERTVARRTLHAIGFEGGLVVACVPMIAWWLDIGLWQAFVLDLWLVVFFLVYTFVFNWCFDRVFGLPASARA
ncbi:MAG: PACE efflux transporter [Candidatus Dactylopiibacterium sp.]|nr:PACE efflux transporter [Candidatus Dactylopiibacterium sp.]